MRRLALLAIIALLTTANQCTTTPEPIETVSIRYDPYSYSMAKLQQSAEAECRAKDKRYAIPVSNDVNTQAVRWAYMNFECVN
ncbi:MAG: hypothetical protein MRY72_04725 [Aquisalinus sp.]|nr:hypothetical protein [Aquisalinus sp.]